MNRRSATDHAGPRGTTVVEVVVGLFLVAMAAGVLAQLMTSAARSSPAGDGRPDVALALDAFVRDARTADHVEATTRSGRIETLSFVAPSDAVRWSIDADALVRDDGATARTMATGLDAVFSLIGPDGAAITTDDPHAVRWCTRLVGISLSGPDGTSTRDAALRVATATEGCP